MVKLPHGLLRLFTLLLVSLIAIPSTAETFAFERDDGLWVAYLGGTAARKVGVGAFPDLSPDGRKVAFVTSEPGTEQGPVRRLAVVSLAEDEVTIFDLPGTNCIRPTWSPDGERIAFSMNLGSGWDLCLVNADGTGFRTLKGHSSSDAPSYGMSWGHDGEAVYYHDFHRLYHLGLDGTELQHWDLKPLRDQGGLDSGSTLSVSEDGRRMLVDINLRKGHHGGRTIWSLDLVSGEATRLVRGSGPRWLGTQAFLFTRPGAGTTSFYRSQLDKPAPQLLFRDGWRAGLVRQGPLPPKP